MDPLVTQALRFLTSVVTSKSTAVTGLSGALRDIMERIVVPNIMLRDTGKPHDAVRITRYPIPTRMCSRPPPLPPAQTRNCWMITLLSLSGGTSRGVTTTHDGGARLT